MSKYPEHEKMHQVKDESQAIGDFLMWLEEQGYELCVWKPKWRTMTEEAVDRLGLGRWEQGRFICPAHHIDLSPSLPLILQDLVENSGVEQGVEFEGQIYRVARWVEVSDEEEARARIEKAIAAGGFPKKSQELRRARFQRFPDSLLADYFDIDFEKFQQEKEEMYESLRARARGKI